MCGARARCVADSSLSDSASLSASGDIAELPGDSGTVSYQPAGGTGNGLDCKWHASCRDPSQKPTFTFTALDTESGWDFVTIIDGTPVRAHSN